MKQHSCVSCGKEKLSKNEVGITQKLIGEKTTVFYCTECLAEYLDVTVEEIDDKIAEFKEQGCKLFE
jgi:biotin operon repressor